MQLISHVPYYFQNTPQTCKCPNVLSLDLSHFLLSSVNTLVCIFDIINFLNVSSKGQHWKADMYGYWINIILIGDMHNGTGSMCGLLKELIVSN